MQNKSFDKSSFMIKRKGIEQTTMDALERMMSMGISTSLQIGKCQMVLFVLNGSLSLVLFTFSGF